MTLVCTELSVGFPSPLWGGGTGVAGGWGCPHAQTSETLS